MWSLAEQRRLDGLDEVIADVACYHVIRIDGLDLPIDIFHKPNEMDIDEFDSVWESSAILKGGLRLPSEIDLYRTMAIPSAIRFCEFP